VSDATLVSQTQCQLYAVDLFPGRGISISPEQCVVTRAGNTVITKHTLPFQIRVTINTFIGIGSDKLIYFSLTMISELLG
jgi:hypothetical protein